MRGIETLTGHGLNHIHPGLWASLSNNPNRYTNEKGSTLMEFT